MPSILHDFIVHATPDRVYSAFVTSEGLDAWWTRLSAGAPNVGNAYAFYFGVGYDWRGRVLRAEPDRLIEWEITVAEDDWIGTRVGAELTRVAGSTRVRFWHEGWKQENDHFRTSSFCWAMYLRLLKRWAELGDVVPYDLRLEA